MKTKTLSRDEKRLYKIDPWSARGNQAKWPSCDAVADCTHWNDGHYGVLCFPVRMPPANLTPWLAKNLPGWVCHCDPGFKVQTIFRTTNSNWKAGK